MILYVSSVRGVGLWIDDMANRDGIGDGCAAPGKESVCHCGPSSSMPDVLHPGILIGSKLINHSFSAVSMAGGVADYEQLKVIRTAMSKGECLCA